MIRQFVFILFAICLVHKAFAAPACMTLQASPQERLINPCAGVVDYSFYVPSGVSLDYLRKKASAKLNSTQLLALSGVCQGAIVRYACSLIYLKCQPNIVLTNPATYNFNIYNGSSRPIPLPIQRPCVSVCTSLSTACAEPLAALAGFSSNCYAKYDYANNKSLAMPYRFDLSNSATQCYSPRMIPLSGPKEKYIRGNTPCNGVVDEFFVLPGPRLNPNYTVLQLPNTIQTVINTGLNQAMSHFPKWLTPECNTAIRQYFCYQVFFRAQGVSVKQALLEGIAGTMYQNSFPQLQAVANNLYPGLLNSPVYFPRYANRSLCYNYERVCMDFRIRAEMPALEPNCERTTGGFELFPNAKNQTVLTSSFPVTMGPNKVILTLKFETEPDYSGYHNTTEMGYEVQCPPNFVTNPDPDNEDITTVHGTGCAAACRTAFWTPSEWSSFDEFGIVISAISVAFCVMVITAIVVTNDWKASFLVFCFTITSLASSIYHLAITAGMPWEKRFCATDALRRRRSAGPSDCIRHSIMSSFLYLVGCIVIFLMAMQRALELSGNQAVLAKPGYNFFQFIIALVPPLLAVGLAWARSYFGFAGATPWCSMDLMPSVYLMGFPTLVICGFTYIVYLYSSARYLRSSQHARVAVSNTSYSLLSTNASGASTGKATGATATPAKAMTVISIGANVDSSPVRAFDDDDDHPAHHHHSSDPLFTRQHQDAEAGAASSNVTGVVLTEVSPASDIEMKQIAAGAHVPSIEAAQMSGTTIKPIINETALHTMRMNIILSACIFGSICIHIGWVILKFGNYFFGTPYYNSMVSYTQCVFRNWDTRTTESYTRVCGMHPHFRPAHSAMNFYILCLFGNMVVMGPMYLMASAFAYWYTKRLTAAASASARTSVATASTVSTVSIATP